MEAYVILKSWNDALYKIEAWSKNYYIAKVYYNRYVVNNPESLFLKYTSHNTLELAKLIQKDSCSTIDDIVLSNLIMKTSKDEKQFVIYKKEYEKLFDDSNNEYIGKVLGTIGELSLSVAPLLPYLYGFDNPITDIIFMLYQYSKVGINNIDIDIVYLWKYILCIRERHPYLITIGNHNIPYDSVFLRVDERI